MSREKRCSDFSCRGQGLAAGYPEIGVYEDEDHDKDREDKDHDEDCREMISLVSFVLSMKTTLETIWDRTREDGVEVLLIGGFALAVHGVVRQTADLDFLVSDNQDAKVAVLFCSLGYEESERTEAFIRYRHVSEEMMDVDIMFVDPETFGKMGQESVLRTLGSTEVRVPSAEHLIALKLHAIRNNPRRELKDLGDIVELFRANSSNVTREGLRALCQRFGPENIQARLEEYL